MSNNQATIEDLIDEMYDVLPTDATVQINAVDRSMTDSTVHLTAKLSAGGEQDYVISMRRDGVSWKVVDVTPEYRSQDQTGTDTTD